MKNDPLAFCPSSGFGNATAAICSFSARREPIEKLLVERRLALAVGVAALRERELHQDDLVDGKSGIGVLQPEEAVGEEPGRDQQDERERNLENDEHGAASAPGARPPVDPRSPASRSTVDASARDAWNDGNSPKSSALTSEMHERSQRDTRVYGDFAACAALRPE